MSDLQRYQINKLTLQSKDSKLDLQAYRPIAILAYSTMSMVDHAKLLVDPNPLGFCWLGTTTLALRTHYVPSIAKPNAHFVILYCHMSDDHWWYTWSQNQILFWKLMSGRSENKCWYWWWKAREDFVNRDNDREGVTSQWSAQHAPIVITNNDMPISLSYCILKWR